LPVKQNKNEMLPLFKFVCGTFSDPEPNKLFWNVSG